MLPTLNPGCSLLMFSICLQYLLLGTPLPASFPNSLGPDLPLAFPPSVLFTWDPPLDMSSLHLPIWLVNILAFLHKLTLKPPSLGSLLWSFPPKNELYPDTYSKSYLVFCTIWEGYTHFCTYINSGCWEVENLYKGDPEKCILLKISTKLKLINNWNMCLIFYWTFCLYIFKSHIIYLTFTCKKMCKC